MTQQVREEAIQANQEGRLLLSQGRLEQAVAAFGRAIAIAPDFANAYINRADALEKLGRVAEAQADRQTANALTAVHAVPPWTTPTKAPPVAAVPTEAPEYPIAVRVDYPERLSRLLIFVKWLLAIPHFIVLGLYMIGLFFVAIAAWFSILFTGNQPRGLFDVIAGFDRWWLRVIAYVWLLTDEYPPFSNEPGGYPVDLEVEYPERLSRGLIFIKWALTLPHWIVLVFYAMAAGVVTIIAWFAILFTARYPRGLFDFVVGYLRWYLRVVAYQGFLVYYVPTYMGGLLTDKYPPFSNL